jgi:AbrB family looped-hinge helix DNA binding protein
MGKMPRESEFCKVDGKGRIVIPERLRNDLQIVGGQYVKISQKNTHDKILILSLVED